MALYEVTLGTLFQSQICVNRWNYLSSGTPAAVSGSFGLASAIGGVLDEGNPVPGTLLYAIGQLLSNQVEFSDIMVRAVYDPIDFYQTPLGFNGIITGDSMPPFAAFGFYTNRTRLDIRRGMKRFPGMAESSQTGGAILGGLATQLQNVRLGMSATLEYNDDGNDLSYAPVVVQREKVRLNPGVEPARWSYRYYEDPAEQLEHIMTSITWSNYQTVRSQMSRQFNRGQ